MPCSSDQISHPPRSNAPPELIHTAAHQALEELRDVIGVLHEDGSSEVAPAAPQPTVADIARLVEDSRRAGASIELRMDVDDPANAPGGLGRDAYRIVQEALTNINKHAPGTATEVTVSGAAGRGLHVTVRNRLPLTAASGPACPDRAGGSSGSPNGPRCPEEHCSTDPPPTATSSSPPTSRGLDERPARSRPRARSSTTTPWCAPDCA